MGIIKLTYAQESGETVSKSHLILQESDTKMYFKSNGELHSYNKYTKRIEHYDCKHNPYITQPDTIEIF